MKIFKQAYFQGAEKLLIRRHIQSLEHACQCRDANCRSLSCQKMKQVITHAKDCKQKTRSGCLLIKYLVVLCYYHAKHCQKTKCLVSFCSNIKHKLKHQQLLQRLRKAQLLRKRMAIMNTRPTAPVSGMHVGQQPNATMAASVAMKPGASPTNLPSSQ